MRRDASRSRPTSGASPPSGRMRSSSETPITSRSGSRRAGAASLRARGPLDMRAGPDLRDTAADIVNSWSERDLRGVFAEYGEEPEAGRVAAAIVRRRAKDRFETADELGRFVAGVKLRRRRSIDPATNVFQAL